MLAFDVSSWGPSSDIVWQQALLNSMQLADNTQQPSIFAMGSLGGETRQAECHLLAVQTYLQNIGQLEHSATNIATVDVKWTCLRPPKNYQLMVLSVDKNTHIEYILALCISALSFH